MQKKDQDPCGCVGPRSQSRELMILPGSLPLAEPVARTEKEPDPPWDAEGNRRLAQAALQAMSSPVTDPDETGEWPTLKPEPPQPPPEWDAID